MSADFNPVLSTALAAKIRVTPRAEAPRAPKSISMSVSQWIGIADNPRQRDTENRARKAKHLFKYVPSHAVVHMAQLRSTAGRFKLDGHTRAWLWQQGKVDRPSNLNVVVYEVDTLEEVMALYDTFDNAVAVESAADRITGALRQHKVELSSPMLRSGKITSGIRLVNVLLGGTARDDVNGLVDEWSRELKLLDQVRPDPHLFLAPVLAAALLTIRKNGTKALPFWTLFNEKRGEKLNGKLDGVEALLQLLLKMRGTGHLASARHHRDVCGKALSTFEAHRRGRRYKEGVKATNPEEYL